MKSTLDTKAALASGSQGKMALAEINKDAWIRAEKDGVFICGRKDENGIDWSHFDFVLAHPKRFVGVTTVLQGLKRFWAICYPYMDKVIEEYRQTVEAHNNTIIDMDEIMSTYVDVLEAKKYMETFINEDDSRKTNYEKWFKEAKAKNDAEYAAIIKASKEGRPPGVNLPEESDQVAEKR